MPTNEERRIVADYLRESNKTEFTTAEIELCEIAACVGCDSVTKLKTRLADLIEPDPGRTCTIDEAIGTAYRNPYALSVRCPECYMAFNRPRNPFKYCPNCGARW